MTEKKDSTELPPSIASAELTRMLEEGFRKNIADWLSTEVDFTGAGPQPLDDSAFGDAE